MEFIATPPYFPTPHPTKRLPHVVQLCDGYKEGSPTRSAHLAAAAAALLLRCCCCAAAAAAAAAATAAAAAAAATAAAAVAAAAAAASCHEHQETDAVVTRVEELSEITCRQMRLKLFGTVAQTTDRSETNTEPSSTVAMPDVLLGVKNR